MEIINTVHDNLCNDFEYNHLMVNRKPPWIGQEVGYHQEAFNSKTFAPGLPITEIKKNGVKSTSL